MLENKTGFWVVDQRPMRVGQMMFTEEMNREIEILKDNQVKRVAIIGSRGVGKTLFAQALAGFQSIVLKVSELGNVPIPSSEAIIVKGIDQQSKTEILRILEREQQIILTAKEIITEQTCELNSFHTVNLEELMPKNQKSFEKIRKHLLNVLEHNRIQLQVSNLQFQLNIEEIFDKLWPNMRQIIRQTQMRSKTGEWISIPV
jgi:ATPase subunit of ABC transporter with duplicated ATPase domains|tara:strand:+ start:18 stop:623 length:606 start_codon:yes stop_codon:yes gene_type:complete